MKFYAGDVITDRFGTTYVVVNIRDGGQVMTIITQLRNSHPGYIGQPITFDSVPLVEMIGEGQFKVTRNGYAL